MSWQLPRIILNRSTLPRTPRITWKLTVSCPCHDPVVFGHHKPCEQWETQPNPNHRPPEPVQAPLMNCNCDLCRTHPVPVPIHQVPSPIGNYWIPCPPRHG